MPPRFPPGCHLLCNNLAALTVAQIMERDGMSKTVDGKNDSYPGNFADAETFPSSLWVCQLGADSPSYMEHKETVKCASRRLPH
jgi:hypothetical protein